MCKIRRFFLILMFAAASTIIFTPTASQASAFEETQEVQVQVQVQTQKQIPTVLTTKYPSKYGSLSSIAGTLCGSYRRWPEIWRANPIKNPNVIGIGVLVKVPCASSYKPKSSSSYKPKSSPAVVYSNSRIGTVIAFAKAQVGKWYKWGTAGPYTYDCSGLVMASYARIGVRLSHASAVMRHQGRAVSKYHLLPGDILWHPGHVVMYIGNGKIVEAAHSGTQIRIRAFRASEWYGARRII